MQNISSFKDIIGKAVKTIVLKITTHHRFTTKNRFTVQNSIVNFKT